MLHVDDKSGSCKYSAGPSGSCRIRPARETRMGFVNINVAI